MNIYDTYYMLVAVREMPPVHTFFRDRYFPTDEMHDIFGTAKVIVDYKEGDHKLAPFVVPEVGGLPVARRGFETHEIEPANISLTRPLTIDNLRKRGFGEALMSKLTPEDRAKAYLLSDLRELDEYISNREEWMCAKTILDNGCTMIHKTDNPDVTETVKARFYTEDQNPAIYTPAGDWDSTDYDWMKDVAVMAKLLTKRGLPATDLVISPDVSEFIMNDERVQKMLDNRRMELGRIKPGELANGATYIGTLNFYGKLLDIIEADETYEDDKGKDVAHLPDGTVVVTAPGCGHMMYGGVTQIEKDEEFHTYAAKRVPLYTATMKPPVKETQLTSKPLAAPLRKNPWIVSKNVFRG